jgi:hypothetical protein
MKFYPRLNTYKASNVKFNPTTLEAYSYDWWRFVERRGQLVVFNDYRYSPSTAKHQYKVKRLLSDLGIQIHATIESPHGLQKLESAIDLYTQRIKRLESEIAKPRSHKRKNLERMVTIESLKAKIKQVNALMKMKAVQS